MIRAVHVDNLTKNIKEMCIEVNHVLSADMKEALDTSVQTEKSDSLPAAGESGNRRKGSDSHLSGYGHGHRFPGSGSGCAF